MENNKIKNAEAELAEFLAGYEVTLTTGEMRDFDLSGDETPREIVIMGMDYLSDLDSERAEEAAFKRCPQSVDPRDY